MSLKIKIHTQIFLGIILGTIAGLILGDNARHLKVVGDIFIRLLMTIIVPLIIASMVTGVVSLGNIRNLGRIGIRTFIYYMATTVMAIAVGLILVNVLRPGVGAPLNFEAGSVELSRTAPSIISIVMDIVPGNLFRSMAEDKVLSIIFFSLLFGVAISSVGEKAKPLAALFEALNSVMLKLTNWIMRLAPVAVFALMAYTIGMTGWDAIGKLALYMATVGLGLAIHGCLTLPALLIVVGRYSPIRFFKHMFSAVATAFSTASSAAALPVTMECLEKKVGVSNKVASFVLPLGATVNMDGTALYEAVAAMFIAQAYQVPLTIWQQLIIMLTATLASIGAAAIPGAGAITLAIVLKAVGLPVEAVVMIIGVDRLIDMFRTSVNVWGDACGAVVVARLEGEKFTESD